MKWLRWLYQTFVARRRPDPAPKAPPPDWKTIVGTCSRCRQSFLAHRGWVDDFDATTILDPDGNVVCLECRRKGIGHDG